MQISKVPCQPKTAAVTPIIKKRGLDVDNMKNYRPVSNIPFLSKVIEKNVVSQLNEHLQHNNLLERNQSC